MSKIYSADKLSSNGNGDIIVDGELKLNSGLYDSSNQLGTSGQVLSSTGTGTSWITPTAGTITTITATGSVSGLTLSDNTVGGATTITLGGSLSLTSSDITTGLGFTPYNSTNPNGYTNNTGTVTSVATTAPITGGTISTTGTIGITQATTTTDGYLSSTDWNIFNNKQASGNYITALTGDVSATGPGSANASISDSTVTGKVLTGVNITGGTIAATDTILEGFGKLQNQVNGLVGGSIFQGTWNASTNTPTLTSSTGTSGHYYIVSVAGTTNLDGITDWQVGDWAIFQGSSWEKVDNTDSVTSVNGQTGAVSLSTTNVGEGTNLYYTEARVSANTDVSANTSSRHDAVSLGTANGLGLSGQAISLGLASTSTNGALSSTDWNTFNGKTSNLGTVTQVIAGTGLNGGTITSSGTIDLANTTVIAGSYTVANITVDAQGRITAASNGSAVTGSGTPDALAIWNTGGKNIGTSNVAQDILGNVTVSTNLTASGNLTLSAALNAGGGSGTNGQVLTSTGSGVSWTTPTAVPAAFKAITIENPQASENITLFYTPEAITLSRISGVITGTGGVPYQVNFGSNRTVATIVNGLTTVSSTTTGSNLTSFVNANIPANNWVWVTTGTPTGTPTSLNLTISYTKT